MVLKWVLIVILVLGAATKCVMVSFDKYPRITETERWQDLLDIFVYVAIAIGVFVTTFKGTL